MLQQCDKLPCSLASVASFIHHTCSFSRLFPPLFQLLASLSPFLMPTLFLSVSHLSFFPQFFFLSHSSTVLAFCPLSYIYTAFCSVKSPTESQLYCLVRIKRCVLELYCGLFNLKCDWTVRFKLNHTAPSSISCCTAVTRRLWRFGFIQSEWVLWAVKVICRSTQVYFL